ncbi:MAG: carboxypeptidase-like regulatory domain-containing protein, partial [Bacteroidetes bacterium]|nr:carboxypeptidase-like regulatory domain-containing protein [Bacteroidota bacterium]
MRKVIFIALILFTGTLFAQVKGTLEGTITDGETNETLIGVNIITNESTGTTTDYDGNYTLTLPIGKYELKISYVGYETIKATVEVKEGTTTLNFAMEYQAKEFDDVVISGSRYTKRASEEVISIEVIKPQLADKTNSIRLDDLIKKVSGVNVADGQASIRAGSSWSYSVGSRVNIVLDGQSLLTPDRSSIRWQYLPMENIGQIEVLKGASSILYGSSAMNGTIHLQTIKPTTTPEMKFVSYVGMLDDYADPDYKKPGRARLNTGGYFSRAHKVSDKFEYVLGFNANYSELPYDEYIDYHLRTNLYTKWNNQAKRSSAGFRLNFSHYQESEFIFWKGPDELALTPIEAIRFKYYNFNIDPYYTKFDKKGNRHELKSRAYYYNPNNSIKGGFINLDYQFHKRFNNAWTVISGASAESLAAYDDSFVPQFQTAFKWAVYAQVDKEWEKVSLTGGVRSEFFKFNNGFGAAYGFVRNDKVSGEIKEVPVPLMRMGVNYNPVKNTFVRFNIGQAFR